jgi:hypothetical protein
VPKGSQGCASGTVVGGNNLIQNGDFAIDAGPAGAILPAAGFTSELPNVGPATYPADPQGGFSIQTGVISYFGDQIKGRPFPGDPQRDAPATQTYFYSNPGLDSQTQKPFAGVLWAQSVPVSPNTTYNFYAYFDNLLIPGGFGSDPAIVLKVQDPAIGLSSDTSTGSVVVPKSPDAWIPVQFSFVTGPSQTSALLLITDQTRDQVGDDFAMTQISLKQCVSGLGIAKFARAPLNNNDGTYTVSYLFTIRNYGVDPAGLTNLQVRDNLAQVFANAANYQIVSLTSPSLSINPGFNGSTDIRLLQGTDTLAAKTSALIELTLRVTPDNGPNGSGPFNNTAIAQAQAGSLTISDNSVPGTDPDPNGNGDPKETGEDLPTTISLGRTSLYLPVVTH